MYNVKYLLLAYPLPIDVVFHSAKVHSCSSAMSSALIPAPAESLATYSSVAENGRGCHRGCHRRSHRRKW